MTDMQISYSTQREKLIAKLAQAELLTKLEEQAVNLFTEDGYHAQLAVPIETIHRTRRELDA